MHTLGGGAEVPPPLTVAAEYLYMHSTYTCLSACVWTRSGYERPTIRCGAVEVPGPARENVESENCLGGILGMANIGKKPGGGWVGLKGRRATCLGCLIHDL